MTTSKRVLITGHNGYLGAIMAPHIVKAGYDVVGLDTGYFRPCTLVPDLVNGPSVRKDIRDLEPDDLEGFDAVVHLAALSNDPLGNLNQRWTEDINLRASVQLGELAKAAGVQRFLFFVHHVRHVRGCRGDRGFPPGSQNCLRAFKG